MRFALALALYACLAAPARAEDAPPPSAEASASAAVATPPILREGPLFVARVEGTINPASADYLVNAIDQAEREGAALLLIELDTPGGLLTATQQIVRAMLDADVPIAVYVSPKGAWAASAGTFITMAAHIAAMAPGASIGAAHPVSSFGENERAPAATEDEAPAPSIDVDLEKAENFTVSFIESIAKERGRNVEWAQKAVRESLAVAAEEAVELNVIDLVAKNREALFAAIDGRTVEIESGPVRLSLARATPRELPMGLLARFLHTIWNPAIALMLLSAGGVLLWIEFSSPGVTVPGVLGVACIVVAAVSLQVLPFSWLGLMLFVGGLVLLGLEALVTTHGLLFAAGLGCMLLGGSMIFDRPDASDLSVPFWTIVVPVVGSFAAFGGAVAIAVGRVLRKPSKLGEGELLGMRGVASSALTPSGTVSLRGELWSADADDRIAEGEAVEVISIDGMRLRVRRAIRRS